MFYRDLNWLYISLLLIQVGSITTFELITNIRDRKVVLKAGTRSEFRINITVEKFSFSTSQGGAAS